jgi:hypothetical protein
MSLFTSITHKSVRIQALNNRHLPFLALERVLVDTFHPQATTVLGYSAQNLPIYGIKIGHGASRIMMWSQMHGNESTTTRAVLDVLRLLNSNKQEFSALLERIELLVLPMVNPDGSNVFTRVNTLNVDLNRDAATLTQPESKILRKVFDDFKPHYCFNLHDQRSIFGFPDTGKPAALSFLAPSADSERSLIPNRNVAIQLISGIIGELGSELNEIIGRFDDSFNENCIGDQFQMSGVPTVLFEAGHYGVDYSRENTRTMVFYALLAALKIIATNSINKYDTSTYWNTPENFKCFTDMHVINAHLLNSDLKRGEIVKFQFEEQLLDSGISFIPKILDPQISTGEFSHILLDAAMLNAREFILNDVTLSNYFQRTS